MDLSANQIEIEALKLPASERARLAERLIASLDDEVDIERAWIEEAIRRDAELESGAARVLSLSEALAAVRERLGWRD